MTRPGSLRARHWAIVAAVAAAAIGLEVCRQQQQEKKKEQRSAVPVKPDESGIRVTEGRWGDLPGWMVSAMPDAQKGGSVLVFLHGYGGRPDSPSLLDLARTIVRKHRKMRVILPEGPVRDAGGRAWWSFDDHDSPHHARGDEQGEELAPTPPLASARAALTSVLKEVSTRHAPHAIVLGGYSQGGMMAMDLALLRVAPVERVAVLSGTLLAASVSGLRGTGIVKEPVFVTHGRRDETLSFAAGERLRTLLSNHSHPVMWRPFDDGHRLPPDPILQELLVFLGAGSGGRH